MKKFLIYSVIFTSLLSFAGCSDLTSTDQSVTNQQEQLQKEGNAEAGLPNIVNFQEKKLLKMIYELRDQANIVDYAYLYNQMTGKLVFIGKTIGYGIPYSTEYSSPEKLVDGWHEQLSVPQSEPNGLFPPSSASGTWLMLIDPKTNQPTPVYVEPDVIVSPFPLTNLQ